MGDCKRGGRGARALGAAAALLAGGCSGDPAPIRYKMTVEVATPGGVKVGATVREAGIRYNKPGPLSFVQTRPGVSFRGEAVPVDIAPGQTLFALLTGDDGESDYARRLPDRLDRSKTPLDVVDGEPRVVELWPSRPPWSESLANVTVVPMLIRFRDVRNPVTVELVDPANLAKSFGPGIRLKRITVRRSDEPITEGILARLPWLDHKGGSILPRTDLVINNENLLKNVIGRSLKSEIAR